MARTFCALTADFYLSFFFFVFFFLALGFSNGTAVLLRWC